MTNKRAKARRNQAPRERRDIPYKTGEQQHYANVLAMLGNGRLRAMCDDGVERGCTIRGSMRRREWVNVGDVVLVALRECEPTKADVVFRYLPLEAAQMRRMGELLLDVVGCEEDDCGVVFEDDDLDIGSV